MREKILFIAMCAVFGLVFSMQAIAGDNLVRFPGSGDLLSPDGRFVLNSLDIESSEPSHFLVVRNVKAAREEIRILYRRYVEVLWSPDGIHLLVNDHGGSDYSDCKVISFRGTQAQIDVSGILRKQTENRSVTRNHHVFVEGVKWLGNDRLLVRVHGYGDIDPNGFTQHHIYEIGTGFHGM